MARIVSLSVLLLSCLPHYLNLVVCICCFRYLGTKLTNICITTLLLLVIGGQVSPEVAQMCMKTAFDNGINFFDTAEVT